jgi:7-cyano-7-deazaguanine reductase
MVHLIDSSPLGHKTAYVTHYDASLLFPIPRTVSRSALGLADNLPFYGCDIWSGYELSWLNLNGKPEIAIAEFSIDCGSSCIIESKSLKLYLNSFNQTKFSCLKDVRALLIQDLSAAAGAKVDVSLRHLKDSNLLIDSTFDFLCVDDVDICIDTYHPQPEFLTVDISLVVHERLCSHLLKSNCPVTGQPDWATLFIEYSGAKITEDSLLRYIISFREHEDFHEHCVERIFVDVLQQCRPESLSVYARYNRRGGLDINPFRSTIKGAVPSVGRQLRQ